MTPRQAILAAVRRNRPAGRHELPDVPRFPADETDLAARFAENLKRMGGKVLEDAAELPSALPRSGVVCSAVSEVAGTRDPALVARPADLADVEAAVVRAVLGVAETGSVLFTEAELRTNAVAYLAQHLVVLLDPADIVASIHDAYERPEFHAARYVVFHTGPSATADIEGVLVHGAQGVRSLTVVFVPRR
ncbi:MAG TPA: LUD domain-containing protein [Rhodopila sp.]|jgi:L-lactate dehydrogenase complex protein LldG|nr:LUD domain-containing protein [Rhodopila sp.]